MPDSEIKRAARALLDRLQDIEESESYAALLSVAAAHGYSYYGQAGPSRQ